MTDRRWIKSDNGLWRSFDLTIRRQNLAEEAKARRAGIRARFDAVIERNGLKCVRGRWVRQA